MMVKNVTLEKPISPNENLNEFVPEAPQVSEQRRYSSLACIFLSSVLIVLAVYVGFVKPGFLSNTEDNSVSNWKPGDLCSGGGIIREENGYIGVGFANEVPCEIQETITRAANQWNKIIRENDITAVSISNVNIRDLCPHLENDFFLPQGAVLTYLLIVAEIGIMDGKGGILGGAAPCAVDSRTALPNLGVIQFDIVDVFDMIQDGTFQRVVLHEIGHVLGIGTLWNVPELGFNLLENPALEYTAKGYAATGNPNPPIFTGTSGRNGYAQLGGDGNVEVEDGKYSNGAPFFDLSLGEGVGSVDSHWKKSTFGNELMTYSINKYDESQPMSILTVKSLEDLGYKVNTAQAEAYTLPSQTRNLRRNIQTAQEQGGEHTLEHDIPDWFNPHNLKPIPALPARP